MRVATWLIVLSLFAASLAAVGFAFDRAVTPHTLGGPPLAPAGNFVASVCGTACSALPAVAAGYRAVAAFGPRSRSGVVDFANRPLEICFAVGSLAVGKLVYAIGSPIGGPMTLFDVVDPDATATQGCVPDPGNDSGPKSVSITAGGSGSWVVRIDQQD
ncbi:MAG: hypothetical protein ABSC73_05305 [Acidimicrobiales bacterium]|jgi:hypothetical protein